jgi:putative SOS response-associated peptidase YedK
MINSRSETVLEKPAFRECFQKRRCLIPADGVYEWKKIGKSKQPLHFGMKDDSLFAFAGIWDRWKSPEGKFIESCSILTTTPNELIRDVHDRMPVILHRNHYGAWLTAPPSESKALAALLGPYEAELMRRYEVSQLVNSPQNDVSLCAESLSAVGRLTEVG